MKSLLILVVVVLLASFTVSVNAQCDYLNPRVGFNIGNVAYAVNIPKSCTMETAIAGNSMTDSKIKVSLSFGHGFMKLSIPSKGINATGELSGVWRGLDTPRVVVNWDNEVQNVGLAEVKDEVTWLASNPEYTLYENGNQRFYFSNSAIALLEKRGFRITRDYFIKSASSQFDLIGTKDENSIIFVNVAGQSQYRDGDVIISGKRKDGSRFSHEVDKDGKITKMN